MTPARIGWNDFLPVLFLFLAVSSSPAQSDYTITLDGADRHLLEVKMVLGEGPESRELQMPVWNALYQIRDFAQYVNWIRAKDRGGRVLAVRELNPGRWRLAGARGGAVVEYQIFADSFGPFGAQFNAQHGFFNLAQVLMYSEDGRHGAMTVGFSSLPEGWRVATPLKTASGGRFTAENYDRLADSPVELGTFEEADFEEGGARYRVVVDAQAGDYDMGKIVAMLHKTVESATRWMDDRPFDGYMFLYHFPRGPAGGGMEHAFSTAIDVNAEVVTQAPEALASVTAHEFFHLWNVKRIRPQGLEPVDYTKENYTRALWFSEGCTSTAADFIELRGGMIDERQFERRISAGITEWENRPAHRTQSAEQSSLDAWLEGEAYYRRAERSVSYYNIGELLGIILDLRLREASRGSASLRELFRWMNENYAKKGIPFPETAGVREAGEAVSHADLSSFFEKYVQGTEEIPWDDFFRGVGLRVEESGNTIADAGMVASRNFDGPMTVSQVAAGGGAERAGLQVGDVILEINGKNVGQEAADSVNGLAAGEDVTVKVRGRRGGERELKWKVGSREEMSYELRDLDAVTPEQRGRRMAWLKGEAQGAPALKD
jgi:predicted metalloprotease with PDZ domain